MALTRVKPKLLSSSAAIQTLLAAADQAGARSALGLGTMATEIAANYATNTSVAAAIANLINAAPGALDTLDELAAAMGDDANFAATITNALALKAPLASPAFSGTPTAPTPGNTVNTTQLATAAMLQAVLAALIGNAAATLHLGTFSGSIIPDDSSVKSALQSLEAAIGGITEPTSGSNANGKWVKLGDGTLICRLARFAVPYAVAARCSATWTLPAAFADTEYLVTGTLRPPTASDPVTNLTAGATAGTVTARTLSDICATGKTTASCGLHVFADTTVNFAAGDILYYDLTAIGTGA